MKNPRRLIRGAAYIPVHDPAQPGIGWNVVRRLLDDTDCLLANAEP
jgi:hypothetical protein